MNFRAIAVVILGLAVWPALFTSIGIGFGLMWPDYRAAARVFFATQDFSHFTLPMMLTNFVAFAITGAIVGWLATRVARTRTAGLVLAVLIFAYAAVNHFILLWGNLPDWYNLVVPWIIGGSVVIGVRVSASPPPMPN